MIFKKGEKFTYEGEEVKIVDFLGEGGQGEVYLINYQGKQYAFKYYKERPDDNFKYNLKNNITKGSPSESFLWPKLYVEFEDGDCGYIMDLRPHRFVSFISYLNGVNKFINKKTMLKWCISLVNNFKLLHEKGFSYQDLNDGSFFLDPKTGDLLICDNDNVSANKTNLGILGKMRYMAPEIVRGDKDRITGDRQLPDIHSDRFSLAIILFLTMCLGNPFEGEVLKKYTLVDEKAEYEMFGTHPVYIYNDKDKSNRPIRGYHTTVLKRYPELPTYIKEAFHKTFTEGLKDRENSRVPEIEWLKLLCRYRDEIMTCECGEEYVYGFYERKRNEKCPKCNKKKKFCYLNFGRMKVLLEPGKELYKFHVDKYSSEYSEVIATVIQNKNNPSLWGIKLNLDSEVYVKDSQGTEKLIPANGVIPIVNKLKIKFPTGVVSQIETN